MKVKTSMTEVDHLIVSAVVTAVLTVCSIALYYFAFDTNAYKRLRVLEASEKFESKQVVYDVHYVTSPCKNDETVVIHDPALRSNFLPYGPTNAIFADTDYTCVPKNQTVEINKNKGDFCVIASGDHRVIGLNDAWHPVLQMSPNMTAPCETVSWVKSL